MTLAVFLSQDGTLGPGSGASSTEQALHLFCSLLAALLQRPEAEVCHRPANRSQACNAGLLRNLLNNGYVYIYMYRERERETERERERVNSRVSPME